MILGIISEAVGCHWNDFVKTPSLKLQIFIVIFCSLIIVPHFPFDTCQLSSGRNRLFGVLGRPPY